MMVKYHASNEELTTEEYQAMMNLITQKMDALAKRNYYSIYKAESSTPEEKELARQLYLNSIGMHKDFRW